MKQTKHNAVNSKDLMKQLKKQDVKAEEMMMRQQKEM